MTSQRNSWMLCAELALSPSKCRCLEQHARVHGWGPSRLRTFSCNMSERQPPHKHPNTHARHTFYVTRCHTIQYIDQTHASRWNSTVCAKPATHGGKVPRSHALCLLAEQDGLRLLHAAHVGICGLTFAKHAAPCKASVHGA